MMKIGSFAFLFVTLCCGHLGVQGYSDLSDLGERISRRVQEQLKPLDNLGDKINRNVQDNMARLNFVIRSNLNEDLKYVHNLGNKIQDAQDYGDLSTLGDRISRRVEQELKPLDNLGERISKNVQDSLAPLSNLDSSIRTNVNQNLGNLNNLGSQIQGMVYEGLEPVRALEIRAKMINGIGGFTVARYTPKGKTIIIKNGVQYDCTGGISSKNGQCLGNLERLQYKSKSDYCYARNKATINNMLCLSAGGISVQVINNHLSCNSDSQVLILSSEEYRNLCQDSVSQVIYKYYADENDPSHVHIPNSNKYVKCAGNERGVCEFAENPVYTTNTFTNGISITTY